MEEGNAVLGESPKYVPAAEPLSVRCGEDGVCRIVLEPDQTGNYHLHIDGERIGFARSTYKLITLLCTREAGRLMVRTKDEMLDCLYEDPLLDEPEAKIIDVFICKLRRKLDVRTGGRVVIREMWGRGYYLEEAGVAHDAPELSPVGRVEMITGLKPDECITLATLPPADTSRWTATRKAAVVLAVRGKLITYSEACVRYRLSGKELDNWLERMARHGLPGLHSTKTQQFRN